MLTWYQLGRMFYQLGERMTDKQQDTLVMASQKGFDVVQGYLDEKEMTDD